MLRQQAKRLANVVVSMAGARLVSRHWGPRGFADAFRRLAAQGLAPHIVVDVGAANGSWTRECRTIFPDATYLLVDPLEENAAALRHLAASDPSRTHVWQGALGAAPGELSFNVHGDQSSFLPSAEFKGQPRVVPVRRLDALVAELGLKGPMLLKADVQGYELEVLKGATQCLPMIEVLLLEVSFRRVYEGPLAHDVIAEAGRLGLRIFDFVSYVQRSSDSALAHADIVFVRDGSPLLANERWGALA